MNVLVVNDDGIKSPGLEALVKALSREANVYVCAPDGQRSAKSQAITIGYPVTVSETNVPFAKKAYCTDGTPADCTKIGLQFFKDEGIDIHMVYSGINMGSNLGMDTLYSGTVGAAMEAAMSGYNAAAVSVDSHSATHFDAASELAVKMLKLTHQQIKTSTVININTPDLPADQIKGVRYTVLGDRYYNDKFLPTEDNKYELSGEPADFLQHSGEFDVTAAAHGYASITPLQFDYTDHNSLDTIKKWSIKL